MLTPGNCPDLNGSTELSQYFCSNFSVHTTWVSEQVLFIILLSSNKKAAHDGHPQSLDSLQSPRCEAQAAVADSIGDAAHSQSRP